MSAAPPSAAKRLLGAVELPDRGLAVDLAGGDGAAALLFAELGFQPALVEVSDVAINLATTRAAAVDVELACFQQDLEQQTLASVLRSIEEQFHRDSTSTGSDTSERKGRLAVALVSCFHYLNRELLASVAVGLPPGATFMASIATVRNLERHKRPSSRFLLEPGELADLIVGNAYDSSEQDLAILHSFEGWNPAGNHEAEIIVRRTRHSRD